MKFMRDVALGIAILTVFLHFFSEAALISHNNIFPICLF